MTNKYWLSATVGLLAVAQTAPAWAQQGASIFSGAPVETTSLANGAIINAGYVKNSEREGSAHIANVRDRVWVLRNYSIVNCIIIETDNGLVVMDTGTHRADGKKFLELIRSRSQKPILAIIYSHNHYTGGAQALVEGAGTKEVQVIGHPGLETNFKSKSLNLRPSTNRRANMQFGRYLPANGPDGRVSPPSVKVDNPADRVPQHVAVTKAVADGQTVHIDGTDFTFYHAEGDTDDSLTVWIPSLETVATNVISQQFFAMSTLRGQPFREPEGVIQSYARIRDLAPEHYVPTHGSHVSGKKAVHHRMEIHRDAYAFTYNQAVRGINLGWTPDEIVERTPLPERFRAEPTLYEGYSGYEYALRGIYTGLIGWFAEDTSELHPPTPQRIGQAIVDGFGGRAKLLEASRAALARKEYNLASVLAGHAVYADPADNEARHLKAQALRIMGRISTGMQAHNFFLTEALELEGKIDTRKPPTDAYGGFGFGTVANSPPETLVSVLESRIDPKKAADLNQSFVVHFTDVNQRFQVDLRDTVVETRAINHEGKLPVLAIAREDWFNILAGNSQLSEVSQARKLRLKGMSQAELQKIFSLFDPL